MQAKKRRTLAEINEAVRKLPKGFKLGSELSTAKRHLLLAKTWQNIASKPDSKKVTLDSVYDYFNNRKEMKQEWKEKEKVKSSEKVQEHRKEIINNRIQMKHQFVHKYRQAKARGELGIELQREMLKDYVTVILMVYRQKYPDAEPVHSIVIREQIFKDLNHVRKRGTGEEKEAYSYMADHFDANRKWVIKLMKEIQGVKS